MELPDPADLAPEADRADEQLLETLEEADYWRRVCPHLHVLGSSLAGGESGAKPNGGAWRVPRDAQREARRRDAFSGDGFFRVARDDVGAPLEVVDALAVGVVKLLQHGWPASFIFVFDEAWQVIEGAEGFLEGATGGSGFIGDVYAWYVDPVKGQRGWGPHRDRMGSGPKSFREDGTPMLSTTWLALTDAGPSNSCLYVVPKGDDPFYSRQDEQDVDPLAAIFAGNPAAYQCIRALPCERGSGWHFSHKIIHWGSHAQAREGPDAPGPRIAMSWVLGDERFEAPAFSRDMLPQPPLAVRVAFVAGQQIAYGGQTGLRRGFKNMCFRFFKRHRDLFGEAFRDKVEFIHFCRPPPPPQVHLKERTKEVVDVASLEFATPQDDAKLDGLKGMFPDSDSDSSEDGEE